MKKPVDLEIKLMVKHNGLLTRVNHYGMYGIRIFNEENMESEEILQVSRELIGSVYPIADSYYDEARRTNANKSYNIISGLIADIGCMSCECFNSQYASVKDCGENGYKILKNLKAEIEDYLIDIE